MVALEQLELLGLRPALKLRLGGLGQLRRSAPRDGCEASPRLADFSRRSAAYSRIVSSIQNRSSVADADEALVDERLERVEVGARRPPRPRSSVQPPRKTASRAKSRCSSLVEQLVAPLDRRAQRLLARVGVAARP